MGEIKRWSRFGRIRWRYTGSHEIAERNKGKTY